MLRQTFLAVTAALALASGAAAQKAPAKPAAPKPAAKPAAAKTPFDKAAFESYIRHLWAIDADISISITTPKPSESLPGFQDVTVRMAKGATTQDMPVLVSSDGSHVIQGNAYNLKTNPFKPNLDKLKTQFQPSMGTPGATVVLVEFSDFECPFCKQQAAELRKNLLKTYPTQVRLYHKDYPLSTHPWAMDAAIAGRCVFNQAPGSFFGFADYMFAHQEAITPANLKDQVMAFAKTDKEVDALQLGRCMEQKETEADVKRNAEEARALGVDGLPALFVNGRKLSGFMEWEKLKPIIDLELKYQATAKNAGEDCGCDTSLKIPGLTPGPATIGPPKM